MADGDLAFLDGPLPPHSLLRSFHDGTPSVGSQAVDLVSLQNSLLQALSRSPDIVEQAKIILNSTNVENKDQEKGVAASDGINKNPPQGRRQGMGRRKARFSMKPTPSQESTDFNLKLVVENLADPEAFFSAVEKYENATREVNKLRGQTSSNAEEKVQFATTRQRRPGLPRKRASYRHLGTISDDKDASMLLTGGKTTLISNLVNVTEDENDNENHHSLPDTSLGKNAINSELFSTGKQEGSVINKENTALLDSLLSTFQRDDEDGVKLLQDKLQLKDIDLKKIRLPDSPSKLSSQQDITNTIDGVLQEANAGRVQVKPTMETSKRTPLGVISLLQNSKKKARLSHVLSSLCQSPLAAMAILRKNATLADSPMSTAYSSSSIDEETGSGTPRGNQASSRKEASKHLSGKSRFIGSQFELDDDATDESLNLQNFAYELLHEDPNPRNPDSNSETLIQNEKDVTNSLSHFSDENINNMPQQELCNDSVAKSPLLDMTAHSNQQLVVVGSMVHDSSDGNTGSNDNIDAMLLEGSKSGPLGDSVEGLDSEIQDENVNVPLSAPQDMDADWNQQPEVDRPDDHDQNINDLSHQAIVSEACKDQPAIHASTDQQIRQPSPSHQAEESEDPRDVSGVLVKRKASKPHPQRGTREVTRRKSLASAGTSWKGGVRRSTRHRIRPLEHWRGERLLYGRIHDSLATVIGVKCSSPGGATLKVKSYVSNKYKDLLELAALH